MSKSSFLDLLKKTLVYCLIGVFLLANIPLSLNTSSKKIFSSSILDNSFNYAINETNLFLTNEYATHYFGNLNDNFGVNEMGSCGYIALGMMISYYDSYWDDFICSEDFENNAVLSTNAFTTSVVSPGAKPEHDLLSGITGVDSYQDASDYLNRIVLRNYRNYLHMRLIMLGNMSPYQYYDISAGREAAGLTNEQLLCLTEEYFYNYKRFDESEIEIDVIQKTANQSVNSANIAISNYIVEKLLEGIPVLIVARDYDNFGRGHAMVAYDYNINTGKIYVHTGIRVNGNALKHVDLSSLVYESLDLAMTLKFNIPHSHSNNYVYLNGTTTQAYCPCSNHTYY